MEKILILGYGNPDRQDDGVAWTVVREVAMKLHITPPSLDEPIVNTADGRLTLAVALQLMPEMAELISQQERVCFIDAHTGRVLDKLSIEPLTAEFQNSPFTHHLTPQTCLSLAQSLYGRTPAAELVSVRGYEFGFATTLSDQTRQLADRAVEHILTWLKERTDS